MVRAAAALVLALAAPAGAAECRLALLLGLDISSSVDAAEDALQRGGMARALLAETVETAFFASGTPVALGVFEWSGRYNQEVILDWTLIENRAELQRASDAIGASRRSYNEFPTAMGEALIFAEAMLARAPDCWQRTIDIAGDGENNEGPGPQAVYASFPAFREITVNGLVIVNAADFQTPHRLNQFYAEQVLHGDGAFMIEANGFNDYERAMRDKLERELSVTVIGRAEGPG
ncbi:DUF1194 domain-containing protein [Marimonas sp. MJW-29]|uniref:DUF1194 domain-containing protein n=1 Tax=Sulfitobacter sediminis TaxID=3234186 RepID=A0ABV3RIS8_9RHOB